MTFDQALDWLIMILAFLVYVVSCIVILLAGMLPLKEEREMAKATQKPELDQSSPPPSAEERLAA